MLDVRYVCDHLEDVEAQLKRRGDQIDLSEIKTLAAERKEMLWQYESNQQKLNKNKQVMATLDKKSDAFREKRDEMKTISSGAKQAKSRLVEIMAQLETKMLYLPNIPALDTPDGKSEADNPVVATWGEKPVFDFQPKEHFDLGDGILDFERGSKITGTKFTVLHKGAARMERALLNLMLDSHTEAGFNEVFTPFVVNRTAMQGTGQLPKFEDDAFKLEGTDYFLVPTAEVPVTNLYANEIIPEDQLPIKMVAYTACFRKEAGSAGRDTRGLIRQHQFNKVELVQISTPEQSEAAHKEILARAEGILQKLGLHYQVVNLCTGDLGFSAAKCYDIEVWLPGQDTYREISSVSTFLDYQARRAKIRYKATDSQKNHLVHTANGSGLAIGRTLVAIFENYQQADGSIKVPEVLLPYMGGMTEIPASSK